MKLAMNLLNYKIYLYTVFFISFQCFAFNLDYIKLQHAGEIGSYAVGIGGSSESDRYSLEFFHGVVPAELGGRTIETMALKNNLKLFTLDVYYFATKFYTGLNIYKVKGKRYETFGNNDYPDRYYRIGSVRWQLYLGGEFLVPSQDKQRLYFESGLNDIVLLSYYRNPDYINPMDYVSLALGYIYKFR